MFENIVAERMGRLHTESAFQILSEANALEAQGRSVIHCEIGQPDFATPDHIIRGKCWICPLKISSSFPAANPSCFLQC